MSVLSDMGDRLIEAGVVEGSTGWALRYGILPNSPDKLVALFTTLGRGEVDQFDPARGEVAVQVRVRGAELDYISAETKMQECISALNGGGVANSLYCYARTASPLSMGYDETSNRPELVITFDLRRDVT